MRKISLLVFLFPTLLHSQVTVKEIKETHPLRKTEEYIFPIIKGKSGTVSNRINNALCSDFLDVDRNKIKKSIFENIWPGEENNFGLLSDISYEVLQNSKRILSISISAEGCGAYCEPFTRYYNFDLQTGKEFKLEELLTPSGKKLLLEAMNKQKKELLQQKIRSAKELLSKKGSSVDKDDKEYYEEMIEVYSNCLKSQLYNSLEYIQFSLQEKTLVVFADRCSAHVNRNVDELGDFEYGFSLANWKKHFSTYGLSLITK
ncbi:hypothetical protein [Lacibacter sediminis]|uniref:Uncharacterized protein n=1 Tax=Lacibacter sediminis TaxID=2760713 RepID=A0A7G5XHG8_9BACT|nr:hypothetical protein [Lacibacter sediminis]QNA44921.1 hypothetical protein H4075_01595 [Lacibacter sediminis]